MAKHYNICTYLIIFISFNEWFFFVASLDASCPQNNACPTYLDYFTIRINSRCYCVPNAKEDPDTIIAGLIGKSERHEVTTEDGYILTMFRMPRDNPKGVVVLWHPFLVNSKVWVFQGNQSVGLWFWQQGYDVWLPNCRGTSFGKKHKTLSTKSKEFWDFSFHESGYYDNKAAIDYIYNATKSKIIFISHSMSTSISLIYTSLRPAEATEKLKVNIAMAPITDMKYMVTPLHYVFFIISLFKPINNFLHIYSAFDQHSWYFQLAKFLALNLPLQFPFALILELVSGWTLKNLDPSFLNIVLEIVTSMSLKTFYHYSQIKNLHKPFQMYDYGSNKNEEIYGSREPPLYPIENITVPTYLVHCKPDSFSTTKDVDDLYKRLQNVTKIYERYECDGVNHVDFYLGKNRRFVVYNKIFELLKKLET